MRRCPTQVPSRSKAAVRIGWSAALRRALSTLVLLLMASGRIPAQATPSEYEVKAAMLYNLTRFVELPADRKASQSDPVVIGVFGADPFGALLEQILRDKTVYGRPVLLRHLSSLPQGDGTQVQILFLGRAETKRIPAILHQLRNSSVLTIGETERFAQFGGIIGLTLEDEHLRLEVNVDAAQRAGIKISSKLLKLATVVRDAN